QRSKSVGVVGEGDVTVDCMEEPKGCVGRVIQTVSRTLRKQIRQKPIPKVMGKGQENSTGFRAPTCGQRQSLEADHRVPAPIGKPVVSRDDASCVIACRWRAGGGGCSSGGLDDEL